MKTIAVTGAAGLLGRHIVAKLISRGDLVLAIDDRSRAKMFDGDAARPMVPTELLQVGVIYRDDSFYNPHTLEMITSCDAIIHAAAQTSHPRSIAIPMLDFEVNALGTLRLLERLRLARYPGRLIFISSAKVYGENVNPPLVDVKRGDVRFRSGLEWRGLALSWFDDIDGLPAVSDFCPLGDQTWLTPFGVSKTAADLYCQQYAKLYGLDVLVLRPGCFTGTKHLAVEEQNWVPPLVRDVVRGEPYTVYGHGGLQVRDLLHVDDLVDLVLLGLDADRDWDGMVMNAGGGYGNDVSLLEVARYVEQRTGKRFCSVEGPLRPGDWRYAVLSNARANALLDWKPKRPWTQLVDELIEVETIAAEEGDR